MNKQQELGITVGSAPRADREIVDGYRFEPIRGQPMLRWAGKRPFTSTQYFPAQEKERLYTEALKKHEAIIKALKDEADADKERLDYLQSLNILLTQAIKDLKKDLGVA